MHINNRNTLNFTQFCIFFFLNCKRSCSFDFCFFFFLQTLSVIINFSKCAKKYWNNFKQKWHPSLQLDKQVLQIGKWPTVWDEQSRLQAISKIPLDNLIHKLSGFFANRKEQTQHGGKLLLLLATMWGNLLYAP